MSVWVALALCCLRPPGQFHLEVCLPQLCLQPQNKRDNSLSSCLPPDHYAYQQSHWAWAQPTIPDRVSSQQQQQSARPYEMWSPHAPNLPDHWAGQGMGAAPGKNSTNSHSSQQKFGRFSSINISQIVSCLYSISRALKWLFLFIVSNFIFAFLKRGFVDLLTWP